MEKGQKRGEKKKKKQPNVIILALDLIAIKFNSILIINFFETQSNIG